MTNRVPIDSCAAASWRKRAGIGLLFAAFLATCGCVSPHFDVGLSPLDVATMSVYSSKPTLDGHQVYRRLELSGSGHVLYKWGRSRRVIDAFWAESTGEEWRDLHQRRHIMSKKRTEAYFQKIVDAGIFDNRKLKKEHKDAKRLLLIQAKISRRVTGVGTADADLLAVYDQLVDEVLEGRNRN